MPQIRCNHNYRKYTLSNNDTFHPSPIIGNAVLVERGIDEVFVPFGGFVDLSPTQIADYPMSRVINIEAFTLDDAGLSGWMEVPKQPVLAIKKGGKHFIPIVRKQLVCC